MGTAGSMWGVLVENFAQGSEQEELRVELLEPEKQGIEWLLNILSG